MQRPAPLRDEDCASRCTPRQHHSVHELYRDHSKSLVRRLTRKTGCVEIAREIANETFVRLLKLAPAKLKSIDQPEAYLWRVSTNLVSDWARTEALNERTASVARAPADIIVDQVSVLESRDILRRLEVAVGKLKPKTRAIFVAHRIEGLSYAEIAARTNLSVKGVEKQMSKAIAKIDRLLDRN